MDHGRDGFSMGAQVVALFGEAEKGEFRVGHQIRDLCELERLLGSPPPQTLGLFFAIRALLYGTSLIFFRVEEEGYSHRDYLFGLHELQKRGREEPLLAIGLPGVGDHAIIEASTPICQQTKSLLLLGEHDLYDYLTAGAGG